MRDCAVALVVDFVGGFLDDFPQTRLPWICPRKEMLKSCERMDENAQRASDEFVDHCRVE